MTTQLDYIALSAIVYNDVRSDPNKLTNLPTGWSVILTDSNPGFTASAFQNGNDIVIAFKGSDGIALNSSAWADWIATNAQAGLGFGSTQLVNAALFYEAVKAANPGANITFTGHSLGGGLASLMAVYFDKPATTFDEAPFLLTAANPIIFGYIGLALVRNQISDSDFAGFDPISLGFRISNVQDHYVSGEFLNKLRSPVTAIYGSDTPIAIGGGDEVSSFTLHSINLAAALTMQDKLRTDTVALPDLLAEIFNDTLYARDLNSSNRDFLTTLLNDQIKFGYTNPNGLLAKFATDIEKLTQCGDNLKTGALSKAVIDAAIEDYYFKQSGSTNDFFNAITGGISFDLADIGADWSSKISSQVLDTTAIYQLLNGDKTARASLSQDNAWSIQSGTDALTVTGTGNNNDAMIGGATDDVLDGGAGNDFLYGGDGADSLTGGTGDDMLIGGAGNDTLDGGDGNDTYILEGTDTIRDSDGKGVIKDQAGNIIAGAIEKKEDGTYVFLSDPAITVAYDGTNLTLRLADGTVAVIENFQSGDLGLEMGQAVSKRIHHSVNKSASSSVVVAL